MGQGGQVRQKGQDGISLPAASAHPALPAREGLPGTRRLWALLIPAAAYLTWASYFRALDGSPLVDGTIGVLLGLYICSHPAANGVDLIFLERGAFRRVTSRWSGVRWLALNGVVMFVGWLVIVAGATEVFARGRG